MLHVVFCIAVSFQLPLCLPDLPGLMAPPLCGPPEYLSCIKHYIFIAMFLPVCSHCCKHVSVSGGLLLADAEVLLRAVYSPSARLFLEHDTPSKVCLVIHEKNLHMTATCFSSAHNFQARRRTSASARRSPSKVTSQQGFATCEANDGSM